MSGYNCRLPYDAYVMLVAPACRALSPLPVIFNMNSVSNSPDSSSDSEISSGMSRAEVNASASLASVFALRMLGLFLILPVFSVHAKTLPGGDNATLVGLAMGTYGLAQSFGKIPFGVASDKYDRKKIVVIGLLLFALGSFIAAGADNIYWVIIGRAIQGAGAIFPAVTAFIADSTRDRLDICLVADGDCCGVVAGAIGAAGQGQACGLV